MTPEGRIQAEIRLALGKDPDLVLWRIAPSSPGSPIRTAPPGFPDLAGVLTVGGVGVAVFIEVKAPTGRMSEEQRLFRDNAARRGAVHLVARSADEAVAETDE